MKEIQLKYKGSGHRRFFYISENETVDSVNAHIYTSTEGIKNIEFHYQESGVWTLDFVFNTTGKYCFIIFEDGVKTFIAIITIG